MTRLSKAGYTAELHDCARSTRRRSRRLEEVIELGREGAPERGFSMAMDSLRGEHDHETLVVLAPRRVTARSAASCTSCPVYGRPAVSLSFMRRDPATPNGLTEFLVVEGDRAVARARGGRAVA